MSVPSRSRNTALRLAADARSGLAPAITASHQALERTGHTLWRQARHAPVIDRTFTKHAGPAPDRIDQYLGAGAGTHQRRRLVLTGRPEQRRQRHTDGRSEVHRAGIIGEAVSGEATDACNYRER